MKDARNSRLVALLGFVLVSFLTVGIARAQERVSKGNFTLTSAVRWGTALLPAGNYSFELDLTNDLITVRGSHRAVMIMSMVHDTDRHVESSALILVPRNGIRTVRALEFAPQKVVVLYAIPKETTKRKEIAREPTKFQCVPVSTNPN